MNVEFVGFNATDGVELQGWLSHVDTDTAVIHIHGMSGNGYENHFLDNLRELYSEKNLASFFMDNRGRGIISGFKKYKSSKLSGSCYEIFEESEYDISGAIDYLKSRGYKKFILQGHSLGCSKVVNFLVNNPDEKIIKVILLAPTDMVGWAATDDNNDRYLSDAERLIGEGKGEELVSAKCWFDETPISAQTYVMCKPGSNSDIYGARDDGVLLSKISKPMLIVYGSEDIGITKIDGSINEWLARVEPVKNSNTSVKIIDDAEHGFSGYENELVEIISDFINIA
jgi:pimeloyl-ACP methyl ester carboxylesterase